MPKILAAGPLRYEPSTVPYRIVLCEREAYYGKPEYVTWIQAFEEDGTTHCGYSEGHYFNYADYEKAVQDWLVRVEKSCRFTDTDTRKRVRRGETLSKV